MESASSNYSADAIVVLGSGVNPDGSVPPVAKTRIDLAVELYRNGIAPRVICSGKYGLMVLEEPDLSEAAAMAEYAAVQGIPRRALLLEEDSRDTLGNAYFTKSKFLQPNGWTSLRVITSDYHLFRTAWVFRKVLGSAFDFSLSSAPSGLKGASLIAHTLQEFKITSFYIDWLEALPEADDAAIQQLMEEEHFGYAEDGESPSMTKEEMYRRLGEVARIQKIAGNTWFVKAPNS